MNPLYIRVHECDNVGIIVAPDGATQGVVGPSGLVVNEWIPQSHKIALHHLETGEPVKRYGQVIGYTNRAVDAGAWLREEMLDVPAPPLLDQMRLSTAVPMPLPSLEDYTFEVYRNADGSTGTKNILGITTTVQCVAPTVDYAVRRIEAEILPHFPNIDDVVAITHGYGCGIAIDAPGAAIPIRTLKHISLHPNVAGQPLIVSLGCEKWQPDRLFRSDLPLLNDLRVIRLQDECGFAQSVSTIMRAAERRLRELDQRQRQTCPASELSVGLQCGGSDAFSGVTCNLQWAMLPICWCEQGLPSSFQK